FAPRHSKQILQPRLAHKRITLEIDEQVVGARLGQPTKSHPLHNRQNGLVDQPLLSPPLHLHPRLLSRLLQRLARAALRPLAQRNSHRRQLSHRRNAPLFQLYALLMPYPCHQGQVIVRSPLRITLAEPPANIAVWHRLWIRSCPTVLPSRCAVETPIAIRIRSLFQPLLHIAEVRRILRHAITLTSEARTRRNHPHPLRWASLGLL